MIANGIKHKLVTTIRFAVTTTITTAMLSPAMMSYASAAGMDGHTIKSHKPIPMSALTQKEIGDRMNELRQMAKDEIEANKAGDHSGKFFSSRNDASQDQVIWVVR